MGINEDREMLISKLIGEGYLKSEKIIETFREVPREMFVPESDLANAYGDYPLQIGCGQTISAPHMVAIMTELLRPHKTENILEIGSGSGYQAAILSKLVKNVYTVELEPELAQTAAENLRKAGCTNVSVFEGDGSRGYPPFAPYDKILVTCATPDIMKAWKDQLKEGGWIIAPVGGFYHQELILLKKTKDGFEEQRHGGCIFVPLRNERL
ncbi:MAG: protein-L-isoaspartate(D-aspartate) O-methyltransferase [Candidatus Aenigmatarchaeota archaeon]|nr:MAG: protein-L-isoaspartate(D-aspartate) O-methyltransferase [Candidatus Aenigmarchaeota archaeon]